MSTVLRSQIECPSCHQIIASLHRHDFRSCRCGAVSLDGGRDYCRVLFHRARAIDRSLVIDADVTKEDARRLIEVLNAVRCADGSSADDPHHNYRRTGDIPWVPAATVRRMIASSEWHRQWFVTPRPLPRHCYPRYNVTTYLEMLLDEGLLEVRHSKTGKRTGWRCTKPVVPYGWYQGMFARH